VGDFSSSPTIVRFGEFELDQDAGELRRDGTRIRVQEQPLQILQILLEQPGKIVARAELQRRIWPSDTFVDFDHGINNAIKRLREALGDTAETPRYVETLFRRGYRFVGSIEAPRKTSPTGIRSLAVLPLENLSRDPEQEYFAEGLTEALITSLAKIGELRVVSRTSSMLYKGARKPLREIANELEVDAIVEGSVLRSGDRVRITAQLIDAAKESHLWAESYERHLRDVLDLQSEVVQDIARHVEVRLTPQEQAQFTQVRPVDPTAYEAYLKGRYHWNRRTHDGFPKGARYFQEVIDKDPRFAAAYAGLADCLSGLSLFAFIAPYDGFGKAKVLATRAVEIDPGLAEAHASVAWVHTWYDFDFVAAEREFERSIELNSRYAQAHGWFGYFLGLMGRYEEAYTECKRAIRLDPLSLGIRWALACVYWMARRYDPAISELQEMVELDPGFVWAQGGLAWAYLGKSMTQAAVTAAHKGVQLSPESTVYRAALAEACAANGNREEAAKILEELQTLPKRHYVTPYYLGRVYAVLGERDEALQWLETAYRERASLMAFLKTDPQLDILRDDPRFEDLMRRMNFPGRQSQPHPMKLVTSQ
jgi:TolB-like protein/Flp pilus assembly protein TadD